MIKLIPLNTTLPTDPSEVMTDAVHSIGQGLEQYGWRGGLAAGLAVLVGVFAVLFPTQWEKLPKWGRLLVVFGLSGASAAVFAFLSGSGVSGMVAAAISTGLSAIGLNQTWRRGKEGVEALKALKAAKYDLPEKPTPVEEVAEKVDPTPDSESE